MSTALRFLPVLFLCIAFFHGVALADDTGGGSFPDGPDTTILMENLAIFGDILQPVAIVMGLGLVMFSLFKFKKYGEMRTMMSHQVGIGAPTMMLLAGVICLTLPTFIHTGLLNFWGAGNPTAYTNTDDQWYSLVEPVIMLIRILGIIAFIRGAIYLSRTGQEQGQPGMIGKACMHIFIGILLINIYGTYLTFVSIFGIWS